ncbi:MAG: hypothetical protein K8T20_09025 [Planctomycetes bacterium]|nr:hypothetical protein [Planctomycetota bacterium]
MKKAAMVFALGFSACVARAGDPPAVPTDEEAKAKIEAIAAAVKGGEVAAIKDAIKASGDCPHVKVILVLRDLVNGGNPDEWRVAAAAALGRMKGSADAATALNGALESTASKRTAFRAVCNAIQDLASRSSISPLTAFVRSRVSKHEQEDLDAIDSALDALGAIPCKASVEAVMDLWQKCKYSGRDPHQNFKDKVAGSCRAAMRRLTGEKIDNYRDWDDWWDHTKDKLNDDLSKK